MEEQQNKEDVNKVESVKEPVNVNPVNIEAKELELAFLNDCPRDLKVNAFYVSEAVKAIKITLCGQQLNPINILRIALNSFIIMVAYLRPLPLPLQKIILTQAIEQVISEQNMNDVEREALMIMIQITVSEALETYYATEQGTKKGCCVIL